MKIYRVLLLLIVPLLTFWLFKPSTSVTGSIHYVLSWDDTNITYDKQGWTVTTPLGYTVHVEQGYLTSYSTELVYCEHSHSFFGWFGSMFPVLIANAGHSGEVSPAKSTFSIVESLTEPKSVSWDVVTVRDTILLDGLIKPHGKCQMWSK